MVKVASFWKSWINISYLTLYQLEVIMELGCLVIKGLELINGVNLREYLATENQKIDILYQFRLHRNSCWLLTVDCWRRGRKTDGVVEYGLLIRFYNSSASGVDIREIIYGKKAAVTYWEITTNPETMPSNCTSFVKTNLKGKLKKIVGNLYGLRTWVEYGFRQCKQEFGGTDYRLLVLRILKSGGQLSRWS